MKMSVIYNRVSEFFKNVAKDEKKFKIIIIAGFLGIALIFFSDVFSDKDDKGYSEKKADMVSLDTQDYKKQIEYELESILSKIQGVGKVSVMVTIEGTTEYIYAQEISQSNDFDNDSTSTRYQSEVVVIDNNNSKEALVSKIIKPKINGVIIVCEGGDNTRICEKVITAVSSVLNISTNRICVAKG